MKKGFTEKLCERRITTYPLEQMFYKAAKQYPFLRANITNDYQFIFQADFETLNSLVT